jgi:glycoprotein 3-alpha-L-fucosyltransferase
MISKEPYQHITNKILRKEWNMKNYHFHLSFENSIQNSYITEKYWSAIQVGTVPIVLGAPDIESYAPYPGSIIDVKKFNTTKLLSEEIIKIYKNKTKYEEMLSYKDSIYSDMFRGLGNI